MNLLSSFKKFLLDFLYPRQGKAVKINLEEFLEKTKRAEEHGEKNILAIFDYREPDVKKLIWELKYKENDQAGEILAKALHQEILGNMEDWLTFENFKDPILVPVPLSKEKLDKRGYNQTEILVRKIVEIDEMKNLKASCNVLRKAKDTSDQTSLKTKKERAQNLKGCFTIKDKKEIGGKNVIIIDDVMTTGATIKEARKVLKENGVKKVKAVVIAH
jgi:competence protein ComFC